MGKGQLRAISLSRDYMPEIMACIESNIPRWSVRHLSLWSELVSPELAGGDGAAPTLMDLSEVEEATTVALFNETKTKISFFEQFLVFFY